MRDAAETAAGLVCAIEQVRTEVESSAGVANLAAEQAGQAVAVTESLSAHAKAIESILRLLSDVAGQTTLLALNATIEAARAGAARPEEGRVGKESVTTVDSRGGTDQNKT